MPLPRAMLPKVRCNKHTSPEHRRAIVNIWFSRKVLLERAFLARFDALERALQVAPIEHPATRLSVAQALL